jgi:Holliday junction resolvase|tara:strand:- start:1508 stop:1756 length:249 start_codon:yes stop_codon:yes gene_type:complete
MTEQQIQSKRIKQLESEGYYVIKLIKTNKNGIPDLLAIAPEAQVLFSEIKTPKGKISKLQQYRLKELKEYGLRTEIYTGEEC